MKSNITGGETTLLFTTKVLSKYDVKYYKCNDTGYIQTEKPYWLAEAYSSAITKLDVGLVYRNRTLSDFTEGLLLRHFDTISNGKFLDYAGGYGLFTRMMRDKGFDFYNTDKFCQNIFAEFQDLKELNGNEKFEMVTAFEVFEHLENPLKEIEEILSYSDNVFFSTEIIPAEVKTPEDWWYFIPETGQHVSLYSIDSLKFIAKKFDRYFYTDGAKVHLFTKIELAKNPFEIENPKKDPYLIGKFRRKVKRFDKRNTVEVCCKPSLINRDMDDARKRISKGK